MLYTYKSNEYLLNFSEITCTVVEEVHGSTTTIQIKL